MTEQGGLLEQKEALDEVSRMLYDLIAPGDTELVWRIKGITVVTIGPQMLAFNPAGEFESEEGRFNAPRAGFPLFKAVGRLRATMHREGAGTWFSATFRVTPEGSATAAFDYDGEPRWDAPPAPGDYVRDLERFPRDAAHIPGWLAARLAEAGAPVESASTGDRDALVAYGREVFARFTDSTDLRIVDLPDGLGVALVHAVRRGGKLFVAPDKSALYSASAQSFEAGLEAFRGGRRSSPEKLLPLAQRGGSSA